jgi:hypothetical protein
MKLPQIFRKISDCGGSDWRDWERIHREAYEGVDNKCILVYNHDNYDDGEFLWLRGLIVDLLKPQY